MDVYFACGNGLLSNDHTYHFPGIDAQGFVFAFIYYNVKQVLQLFLTITDKCCIICIHELFMLYMPTFNLALLPNSLKMFSLYILKRSCENTQPWYTPSVIFLHWLSLLSILIAAVCSQYNFQMNWMSFLSVFRFCNISSCLTLSKPWCNLGSRCTDLFLLQKPFLLAFLA